MGLKISQSKNLISKILGWAILIIILLTLVKLFVWESNYYAKKSNEQRAEAPVVLSRLNHIYNPDESTISAEVYDAHQVAADEARYLKIARLGVDAIVEKSSEIDSNTLPIPGNIHKTLWYAGSSRPGQNGNIIISGLSNGSNLDGAFKNLDALETDDEIVLVSGNNFEYTYAVKESRNIINADLVTELNYIQDKYDDQETLTLVAAKPSNQSNDDYESATIIRAVLTKSTETAQ